MNRSHFLVLAAALGAFYLMPDTSIIASASGMGSARPEAETSPSPQSDNVAEEVDAFDVISAIRTEVVVADKLTNEFEPLAGSHDNAQSLVVGLRNAKPVKMIAKPAKIEVNFTPPTRPMSFADIHTALSLAQAQLQSKHIDNPTPSQIKAALAGGALPNANGDFAPVAGILSLHRRGMSWDQIARALNIAPPPVHGNDRDQKPTANM